MEKPLYSCEENSLRVGEFKKDAQQETFLKELNRFLSVREKSFYISNPKKYPNIFIFGLPRSGTTLLSQILAHCLDIGYINNMIARFWEAPLQGVRLSTISLGERRNILFKSNHGVTPDITGIHEFGYFWSKWLGFGTEIKRSSEVDWLGLQETLEQIAATFDKPVMYKNLLIGMHLESMLKIFDNSLFIWVRRNLVDNAVSILQTREKRYGDKNIWWSLRPQGYEKYKNNSCYEQIAYQIKTINSLQKEASQNMKNKPMIISYAQMCNNPGAVVEAIQQHILERGLEVKCLCAPPSDFAYKAYKDHTEQKLLKQALLDVYTDEEIKRWEDAT